MKFLRPIKDKHVYTRKVFKAIFAAWFAAFWQHLMQAIELVDEYYNSKGVLIEAIMSHRIQYVDGKFTGSFNAAISKELLDIGAKYDKRSKAFIIARNKLPVDINHAVAVASLATATMYKKVIDFLNSFNPADMMPLVNGQIDAELDEILEDLDDQAKKTIEDSITIQVHLSPTEKQQLKQMYTDNLQLPIKNFTQDQVVRIRQLVEQNLFRGLGDKALVDVLIKEFNITRNKAMFWARQETGLLVSAYRQATYKTVGITKYKWSTSHDERVRVMHKDLDGKIFEFANPPVTNEKGDRNNPGEDWQCRCQAIPVFENNEYHNGGKGSGNFGHAGRRGLRGGSTSLSNWFKGSKVSTSTGEPLLVYRGTQKDFTGLQERQVSERVAGIFFSSRKDIAKTYWRDGGKLLSVYLNMQNPYIVYNHSKYRDPVTKKLTDDVVREAKQKGCDGVILKNIEDVGPVGKYHKGLKIFVADDYVVFKPEQIWIVNEE